MTELPEIELRQYSGVCKGLRTLLPIDVVIAKTEAGERKIGFVDRKPNATLRFIWFFLDADFCQAVRRRVAELRQEYGGFPISDLTVGPPDPRIIRGYLKGERYRERPTTIVMPNGEPAGTVTELTTDNDWSDESE